MMMIMIMSNYAPPYSGSYPSSGDEMLITRSSHPGTRSSILMRASVSLRSLAMTSPPCMCHSSTHSTTQTSNSHPPAPMVYNDHQTFPSTLPARAVGHNSLNDTVGMVE